MGMKRGAFESVQLSQVADSAKNPNVQIDSVARGMRAFGAGLGAVANLMGKLGDMADKAYKARQANVSAFNQSLNDLAAGKTKLDEVKKRYDGVNTDEARDAISAAQRNVDTLQQQSDFALDKYKRSGILFGKIGTSTAESGRKRRLDTTKDGEFNVKDADNQSVLGAMFFQTW
jgi:hypothetical protein